MKPRIKDVKSVIKRALREDIGSGDLTCIALRLGNTKGTAQIIAKQNGILCGGFIIKLAMHMLNPDIHIMLCAEDGEELTPGRKIAEIAGPLGGILSAERTVLNFLGHLSGVSTYTRKYVEKVTGLPVKILETRKTTPGLRQLEKYATRTGGATNHRQGLYDAMMIKDNHVVATGSIEEAVRLCLAKNARKRKPYPLVVEVDTLEQLKSILDMNVTWVLLDNMTPDQLQEAVKINNGRAKLEASGGVKLENLREIAGTGVDYISVGALTHQAVSLDFSMEVLSAGKRNEGIKMPPLPKKLKKDKRI